LLQDETHNDSYRQASHGGANRRREQSRIVNLAGGESLDDDAAAHHDELGIEALLPVDAQLSTRIEGGKIDELPGRGDAHGFERRRRVRSDVEDNTNQKYACGNEP